MIKIEQISKDAHAYFERADKKLHVRPGSLLSQNEFDTLVIEQGTITYSVDELEVLIKSASTTEKPTESAAASTDTKKAAPKIVYPSKRK